MKYNVFERGVEKDGTLQACKDLGVTLVAHSPLQQGLLTGRTQERPVARAIRGSVLSCATAFLHCYSPIDRGELRGSSLDKSVEKFLITIQQAVR